MSSLTTLFGDFVKRPSLSLTSAPASKIHSFPDLAVATGETIASVTPASFAYSGSMYVMAYSGGNGTIKSSPDGITWTVRTLTDCANVRSVAYGAGKFMAYGLNTDQTNYYIYTSTDGISWTNTWIQPEGSYNSTGRLMDGGNCVLYACTDGAGTGLIYKSTNGTTWTGAILAFTLETSGNYFPSSYASCFTEKLGSYRFLVRVSNSYSTAQGNRHNPNYTHYTTDGTTWSSIRANTIAVFYQDSKYYVFDTAGDVYTTTNFSTYTYCRKWRTQKTITTSGSYGGTVATEVLNWGKLINKFIYIGTMTYNYTISPYFVQVSDVNTDLVMDNVPSGIQSVIGGIAGSAMVYWYSGISFGNKHWFYKSNGSMACISSEINELVTL